MNRDFIVTKEHRRFTEFAGAIRKDVTIGICHGEAGVGKTQSARRYAHWDTLEPFIHAWGPRSEADLKHYAAAHRSRTVFYTPEVLAKHRDLMRDIEFYRGKVGVKFPPERRGIHNEGSRCQRSARSTTGSSVRERSGSSRRRTSRSRRSLEIWA